MQIVGATRRNHFPPGVRYKVGSTASWCSRNVSTVYGLVSPVPSGLRTSKRALFDPACAIADMCLYDLPKLKTPHRPLPDRPFSGPPIMFVVKPWVARRAPIDDLLN
jgi:hypothetical protein